MKIGLQTWGTDGDFNPFLALAIGLKNAGHEVTLAYTSVDGKDHSHRPEAVGVKLINADGGIPVPTVNPYDLASKPGSFTEYSRLLETCYDPFSEAMYAASVQLCKENDVVIGHAVCHTLLTASQKFGVPRISLVLTPLVVHSKFVSPIGVNLGPMVNSLLWSIGGKVSTHKWFSKAKQMRQDEGFPPIQSLQKELFTSDLLTIVAASGSLVPRPKDWSAHIQMTGFLNLDNPPTEWQIPEELKEFLEAGEPPVYMTFGSCMQFSEEESTELLIETAKRSGQRAIIQSNWNSPQFENKPNLFRIGQVPHNEVFPHCSVIVHHGGAGTTQAALLAGKPSVVVAHGFDQPYWGQQLRTAKAGGKVFQRRNVNPAESRQLPIRRPLSEMLRILVPE